MLIRLVFKLIFYVSLLLLDLVRYLENRECYRDTVFLVIMYLVRFFFLLILIRFV